MASHMTISKRFILTSSALLFASLLQATVAVTEFSSIKDGVHSMTTQTIPGMTQASLVLQDLYHLRSNFYRHMLSIDVAEMARLEGDDDAQLQALQKDIKTAELDATRDDVRQKMAQLEQQLQQVNQGWQQILPISREGRSGDANVAFTEKVLPIMTAMEQSLVELQKASQQEQDRTSTAVSENAGRGWWLTLMVSLVGLTGGSLTVWFMITRINKMLQQAVVELSEGAEQIVSAATQVSSSSQSLAEGASKQADSMQGTSASAAEVNTMARKATDNSRSTADMFSHSQKKFEETNRFLEEMVVAMEGIGNSSSKIAKIIKVIDEIAFQTNILALNAAVEAARAGEAGAGFAVVADEVRNLAQRCAQAAKDTTELIEDSTKKAHDGKARVDEVANAIRLITAESSKMKILIDEINVGSQEQARGIEDISRAITQVEQVTQSTASIAEESAAAAEELNAQSQTMKDVIERINAMVGGQSDNPARQMSFSRRVQS